MSGRAAALAVCVAFLVGVIGALSLRPAPRGIAAGDAPTPSGEGVDWRVPSAFGTNLPVLGDTPLAVADDLRAMSGGALRLEIFDPGEIVPAFQIVDAVKDAKIQAGFTWLGYDQGKLPVSVLFGAVPFGMEPWEYMAWWYEAGGRALADEIYAREAVVPIFCGLIGPETAGWFRQEVATVDAISGLKIRFAGLGGKVLQRLGASVTMLPGGEIFQALEKGAIDATEFSLPAIDKRLGFDRVVRINYFPGWHQPFTAFHLIVGDAAWNALGPERRAMVETACRSGVTRSLARAEAQQGPVLEAFAESGVEARRLPAPVLEALRRETEAVLAEEAEADPDFARVLAHQRAFRTTYARWRSLAYPPPVASADASSGEDGH